MADMTDLEFFTAAYLARVCVINYRAQGPFSAQECRILAEEDLKVYQEVRTIMTPPAKIRARGA